MKTKEFKKYEIIEEIIYNDEYNEKDITIKVEKGEYRLFDFIVLNNGLSTAIKSINYNKEYNDVTIYNPFCCNFINFSCFIVM
jgi:hypothetical protein